MPERIATLERVSNAWHVRCYLCRRPGHSGSQWPERTWADEALAALKDHFRLEHTQLVTVDPAGALVFQRSLHFRFESDILTVTREGPTYGEEGDAEESRAQESGEDHVYREGSSGAEGIDPRTPPEARGAES